MRALLFTSSTRVLLNGEPGEVIHHRRGLRQGDPLSPMVFIIVMDVLNAMIVKASEEGLFQPLAFRPLSHRVSMYADDVALFLRPNAAELGLVMSILEVFGEASGLRTNVQKCSVLPISWYHQKIHPAQW